MIYAEFFCKCFGSDVDYKANGVKTNCANQATCSADTSRTCGTTDDGQAVSVYVTGFTPAA